ncbi:hypothetical protein [Nocardioides sp.]
MSSALTHGLAGLAAFAIALAAAAFRFKGGEDNVASTDIGLD